MVRDALPVLQGRLGGGHVEAAIDLEGVAADDLAAQELGETQCEVGLSGAGGAENRQQAQAFFRERRVSPRRSASWYSFTVSRK
jgi:hypothetical protein